MPDGLTWETATTTDVGLDFGMLNNRLQFNGDYYIRKTTDMYTVGETLPDVFGASSPKGNYADMTTKGWGNHANLARPVHIGGETVQLRDPWYAVRLYLDHRPL